MPRLSRKIRACKWIGTVGCVLMAAVWVGSEWWILNFQWISNQQVGFVSLADGNVSFGSEPTPASICVRVRQGWHLAPRTELRGIRPSFLALPDNIWCSDPDAVILPLGLLFFNLLIATLLLWQRDRRRPGLCRRCEYDLTGNVSGKCPECGSEIAVPGGLNVTEQRR